MRRVLSYFRKNGTAWAAVALNGSLAAWVLLSTSVASPEAWVIAGVLVLLGAFWAWALTSGRRHAERLAAGLCPACGYDLRATPGRSPECGAETKGANA